MTAALYARLDQARTRQYPQASTMEFALWLLETALNDYERAEQHARMTKAGLVTSDQARRLIDVPPPHQLIVR